MPEHAERVLRNYPEGVPAFGAEPVYPEICGNWNPTAEQWKRMAPNAIFRYEPTEPQTMTTVASPELITAAPATEPPVSVSDTLNTMIETARELAEEGGLILAPPAVLNQLQAAEQRPRNEFVPFGWKAWKG